jgi:hypothetical protein
MIAALRRRCRELLHGEEGIALPMALMITVIAMGLTAVPILASINTDTGDTRDQNSNVALAAAEAGMSLALLRQNQLEPTSTEPCVTVSSGKLAKAKAQTSGTQSGWCSAVALTSSSTPAPPPGTEVSYSVKPCYPQSNCAGVTACGASENYVKVVSTGKATVAGRPVQRRIATVACSKSETKTETKEEKTSPPDVWAAGQMVGVEWVKLANNAQVYNGGLGTNGSIKEFQGSANVCGVVQYGVEYVKPNNGSENPPPNCSAGRTFVKGTAEYPPVSLPANIATENSNSLLVNGGNVAWNASNRTLQLNYNSLTLNGSKPYFLCQLVLAGGGQLLMASGSKIRIFFDNPANCPGLNNAVQLQIANGTYVGPDSANGPGFYFVGSDTLNASRIELGGGSNVSQFVVYAPKSTVQANNGVNVNGAVVGRTLELQGGAQINKNGKFTPPPTEDFLSTTTKTTTTTTTEQKPFARKSFVQCSSTGATEVPESGC